MSLTMGDARGTGAGSSARWKSPEISGLWPGGCTAEGSSAWTSWDAVFLVYASDAK